MYVVLLGPPGSGKGTQAERLAAAFGLAHISTGDLFRENIRLGTELGKRVQEYLSRGELVPDDVTIAMVAEQLRLPVAREGAVFDGFPRTVEQAQALDRELARLGKSVDKAVELVVPDDEVVRRLSGRRICRVCQAAYHVEFNPPSCPGRCDKCGGELYQREDDRPEVLRRRLEVYHRQTTPVIEYYRQAGVLRRVDGTGPIEEVGKRLADLVRQDPP